MPASAAAFGMIYAQLPGRFPWNQVLSNTGDRHHTTHQEKGRVKASAERRTQNLLYHRTKNLH